MELNESSESDEEDIVDRVIHGFYRNRLRETTFQYRVVIHITEQHYLRKYFQKEEDAQTYMIKKRFEYAKVRGGMLIRNSATRTGVGDNKGTVIYQFGDI